MGHRSVTARVAGLTHRDADWSGLEVVVTGLGVSGAAAARALLTRGARVSVLDAGNGNGNGNGTAEQAERADALQASGARVRLGPAHTAQLPTDLASPDLVVTSPGWRPGHPVLSEASRRGIPVWGEVELAWRMRPASGAAPWLTVTGTNGKTTTVQMLESMLRAAGHRAVAAGNVGIPLLDAVLHPEPYDVIAAELSSFQLHYAASVSALASCCLNVAPDHVDWHGSMQDYTRAKGKVYEHTQVACVYNAQDPVTERLVRGAEVVQGARAVGFTLGLPAPSMLGLVDGVLADRAFISERATSAAQLATLSDLPGRGEHPAPHLVADALAAAALGRAYGISPRSVRDGLRSFRLADHRITELGQVGAVSFVDDSKATNPHAARASLASYDHIVWVAGGQLKGAQVDDLVAASSSRLRAVVLLGQDRAVIAQALARHAPDVPVSQVVTTDTGEVAAVMDEVIERALAMAEPGDVVLLAPAAASLDMFPNYQARGTAFAEAVRRRQGRP